MTDNGWDTLPMLLTVRQVAEVLNCHINTVKRMLADGRLQGVKIGRDWRIERRALREWIAAGGESEVTK